MLPMAGHKTQGPRGPKQKPELHRANSQSYLGTEAGGDEGLNLPRVPYASEEARECGSEGQPGL